MYLLDTNVVSALRVRRMQNALVWKWAEAREMPELFLSVVTILELERGTLLMERKDGAQGAILRTWLDNQIMTTFSGRILPIDAVIAKTAAAFHVPDPRPERDALIAATAVTHRFTVVTRNDRDFRGTGALVTNPWAS